MLGRSAPAAAAAWLSQHLLMDMLLLCSPWTCLSCQRASCRSRFPLLTLAEGVHRVSAVADCRQPLWKAVLPFCSLCCGLLLLRW